MPLNENREAEHLIDRLPDVYTKDRKSRLFALFRIIGAEISETRKALTQTAESRDFNKAKGLPLDHIGWENLRVSRGSATDAGYLMRIRAKIMQYRADSTIDAIIYSLAFALNRAPSDIGIVSPGHEVMEEPASLLIAVPFDLLETSTLTGPELQELIKNMVAAGVASHIAFNIHGGIVQFASWPSTGAGPYFFTGHLIAKPEVKPMTSGFLRKADLNLKAKDITGAAVYPQTADHCGRIPVVFSRGSAAGGMQGLKSVLTMGDALWLFAAPISFGAGKGRRMGSNVRTAVRRARGLAVLMNSGNYYCGEGF